jgi:hypothetical protein
MISKKLRIAITCVAIAASATFAQAAPILPFGPVTISTVPSNGDVNPYGVAFAPSTVPPGGVLQPGNILVSNYNNAQNLQGTGRTIIRIDQHGQVSTFFTSPSYQGLTGALGILSNGLVLVGSLPTADGTSATVQPGAILVIDQNGALIATLNNKTLGTPSFGPAPRSSMDPGDWPFRSSTPDSRIYISRTSSTERSSACTSPTPQKA